MLIPTEYIQADNGKEDKAGYLHFNMVVAAIMG
jgi:hypothetical protein